MEEGEEKDEGGQEDAVEVARASTAAEKAGNINGIGLTADAGMGSVSTPNATKAASVLSEVADPARSRSPSPMLQPMELRPEIQGGGQQQGGQQRPELRRQGTRSLSHGDSMQEGE